MHHKKNSKSIFVLRLSHQSNSFKQNIFCAFLIFIFFGFSVSVWSDEISFGILGDAGIWNKDTKAILKSMEAYRTHQLVLPGDNLYEPEESYDEIWSHWKNKGFLFPVVAIGNHTKTYQDEIKYFEMPHEFYSKSEGNIKFIVLNSDNEKNAWEQTEFLKQELSRADEKFVFVVFHHPPVTVSERHQWIEKKIFHQSVRPVLITYRNKITALIVGHDHIASLLRFGGIPMIVSGAAHEQKAASPVRGEESGISYQTEWLYKKGPHWVQLLLNPSANKIKIVFIAAKSGKEVCTSEIKEKQLILHENCAKN